MELIDDFINEKLDAIEFKNKYHYYHSKQRDKTIFFPSPISRLFGSFFGTCDGFWSKDEILPERFYYFNDQQFLDVIKEMKDALIRRLEKLDSFYLYSPSENERKLILELLF